MVIDIELLQPDSTEKYLGSEYSSRLDIRSSTFTGT
jgi:hypothetical protein